MKAIYLDCFSGISGNMLLGVFLLASPPAMSMSGFPIMMGNMGTSTARWRISAR